MSTLVSASEVRDELERQIACAGGVRAFAARAGVTHPAIVMVRSGDRPVSERIANSLGYEAVTMFRKIARGVANV